jgi:predicted ABC-type ATPase
VDEFVNADTLARGLSAFHPDAAAIEAGRIMLRRLDQLAKTGVSFAFESTLASRGLARRLAAFHASGYETHVLYLWLPTVDLALARVAERVRIGGHEYQPHDSPAIRPKPPQLLHALLQNRAPVAAV